MINLNFRKWIIISKDRKYIAKEVPRNRHLISIEDKKDKKRILYYDTKNKAVAGYTKCGFYNQIIEWKGHKAIKRELIPLEVEITIKEI